MCIYCTSYDEKAKRGSYTWRGDYISLEYEDSPELVVDDGDLSPIYVDINYCPWCGRKLT